MFDRNLIVGLIVVAVFALGIYAYAPQLRSMLSKVGLEGFANHDKKAKKDHKKKDGIVTPNSNPSSTGSGASTEGSIAKKAPAAVATASKAEGFADYLGSDVTDSMGAIPMGSAQKPQGCYPREQLNPSDLLPKDMNSAWAEANPTGQGDIAYKNFLSSGALVGVNTIGQSLRNANYQLRAEPANPQVSVGPWQQSTIEPDLQRRQLD
jgi:hypothetical protein